jgi:hypothetical protein
VRNVEITSHFLPIDYIYITPQWVVPAVTFPLILFFVCLLSLAALPLGVPFFSGVPERPARFRLFTVQKNFLVIVLSGAIALTALSVISQCRIVDRIQAGAARELSYSWPLIEAAVQALLVPCALIFYNNRSCFPQTSLRRGEQIRHHSTGQAMATIYGSRAFAIIFFGISRIVLRTSCHGSTPELARRCADHDSFHC